MYARAQSQFKRSSQLKSFPAPVAGWIANRELANPNGLGLKQGAAVLDNFLPTTTGCLLRRGKELYATLGEGTQDTTALFSYVVGNNRKLFASTPDTIYDITSVAFPENVMLVTETGDFIVTETGDTIGWGSTDGLDVWTGATGGKWITAQMATTGGVFLLGVNGASTGFIYDGTSFYPNVTDGVWTLAYDGGVAEFTAGETVTGGTSGATATIFKVVGDDTAGTLYLYDISGTFQDNEAITDGEGGDADVSGALSPTPVVPGVEFPNGLTSADMSFVFVYKRRVIFVQKNSLSWFYLDPDAVGGLAEEYPMGGEFTKGGSIMFGSHWSLGSGASGGLSDQCAFFSTEGQVVIFQGDDPSSASSWAKVGEYEQGIPLGLKSFIHSGGDVINATSLGMVPLSVAIQTGQATMSDQAVSFSIEDAWGAALLERGRSDWVAQLWADNQMLLVSPPTVLGNNEPVIFVANVNTWAWARYTNWHAISMHVFEGLLYFGSPEGKVFIGNATGMDGSDTYTGVYVPLFEDFGAPASMKIGELGRAITRSQAVLDEVMDFHTDFDLSLPAAPNATPVVGGSEWNVGLWDVARWNDYRKTVVGQDWHSVGGYGYMATMSYQVTSGSIVPLDVEIVRLDCTFTMGDIVS